MTANKAVASDYYETLTSYRNKLAGDVTTGESTMNRNTGLLAQAGAMGCYTDKQPSGQNRGPITETASKGGVQAALEEAFEQLNRLERCVEGIYDRLKPVLLDGDPHTNIKEQSNPTVRASDIAEGVRHLSARVEAVNVQLNSLSLRLDL
jgi:hypothetical protein